MSFNQIKQIVQDIIELEKGSLTRNFPHIIYKKIKDLSSEPLPENPSIAYPDEWKGWQDFFGKKYFNSSEDLQKTTAKEEEKKIIRGVIEITIHDVNWNRNFVLLQEYYHEYGSLIVTQEQKELQIWTGTQRSLKKRGMLKKEREIALTKINFDWEAQQSEWDYHFNLLISFKGIYGHMDVPTRFKPNYRLGQWAREQRIRYRNGTLRKDRVKRLEQWGFRWSIPNSEKYLTLENKGKKHA